jgi:hypothetical protein
VYLICQERISINCLPTNIGSSLIYLPVDVAISVSVESVCLFGTLRNFWNRFRARCSARVSNGDILAVLIRSL